MHTFESINKREAAVLFLGDVVFFYISLWLMLFVRFFSFPEGELLTSHITPFSILFAVWVFVFFIAGLYEKQTSIFKDRLPSTILRAQIINSVIAVLFFYLIPYFGITPKTNLFIYLVVSFGLILLWRLTLAKFLGSRRKDKALIVGSGDEIKEILDEVNSNNRYGLIFIESIDLSKDISIDLEKDIVEKVINEKISVVVIDVRSERIIPILPKLYTLIYSKVRFIDIHRLYEDIFDRVPLSLIRYSWFLENVSASPKFGYDFLKRSMDIVVSLMLGVVCVALYPLVWILIFLDDRGPTFFVQERVGERERRVKVIKFRSMSPSGERVTRIGAFLRKTRIDELPQLWNVLRGDLSLIGPRPELPALVEHYEREVPYYNIRHLMRPGLSGWAQLYHENHPHHAPDVSETKTKLSYDLYYIKNRSPLLDLKIALKTLKTLISRTGA